MRLNAIIISIAACVLLSLSCKKNCHETWTISGRLLNGSTMKPLPNTPLEFHLASYFGNHSRSHNITIGNSMTDDSGNFNFEYACNDDYNWNYIEIRSPRDYKDTFYSISDFKKNLIHTVYWSDTGTTQIILDGNDPLYGDTLFIAYDKSTLNGSHNFIYRDSFTSGKVPFVWKTIKSRTGKGGYIYWGKGEFEFLNVIKNPLRDYKCGEIWVYPDPETNIYTVHY